MSQEEFGERIACSSEARRTMPKLEPDEIVQNSFQLPLESAPDLVREVSASWFICFGVIAFRNTRYRSSMVKLKSGASVTKKPNGFAGTIVSVQTVDP